MTFALLSSSLCRFQLRKYRCFSSLASEAVQSVVTSEPSSQGGEKTTATSKDKVEKKVTSRSRKVKVNIPLTNIYNIFPTLRQYATAKFDETVEMAVKLAVDPRKPNQSIKGVAKLPSGTGKKVRVAVFATGDDLQKAREAGADVVGSDDLIQSIQSGNINFDRVIATPEMMAQVSKIGKILGPKGLMPNPKMGTVTKEVVKAVKAAKQGSVQYKVDKTGIIHAGIGKISFTNEALLENVKAFMLSVGDQKPENYKGKYIETVHVCSTMGPGIPIELSSVDPSSPKFFIDPTLLKMK